MKKQVAHQDAEIIWAERTSTIEKPPPRGGGLGFNQQACVYNAALRAVTVVVVVDNFWISVFMSEVSA
ncbi:hypothetical protein BH10BAC3_BH10BAC3_28620 [soil metagenome]